MRVGKQGSERGRNQGVRRQKIESVFRHPQEKYSKRILEGRQSGELRIKEDGVKTILC